VPSPTLSARELAVALARPLSAERAEQELERLTGMPTVLFASARGALAAAFEVLAPGGSVALPAYTCMAVANAVASAGATPVWVDVDSRGLVPVDAWPKADVCVVQDTYGFEAPLPPGRVVVRDAAHRADAVLPSSPAAAVTVTSLEQSKWISAGQGGIAAVPDASVAQRLRARRDLHRRPGTGRMHAIITLLGVGAGRAAFAGRRVPTEILNRAALALAPNRARGQSVDELSGSGVDAGLRGRSPGTVARLAVTQLGRADDVARHRRDLVQAYDAVAGVHREPEPLVRYPLWTDDRDATSRMLREAGWELSRPWFASQLHPSEPPFDHLGLARGAAPGGEALATHAINLPTHPLVRRADAEALISAALQSGARPLR
jgi:dTDP-4-amino-4,6-dideoxygalactose transaminase